MKHLREFQQLLSPLLRNRMFLAGLAVRLALLLVAVPVTYSEWFVPFLQNGLSAGGLDPWGAHLAQSGDTKAFPYGVVMFAALAPAVAVGSLLDRLTGLKAFASIGLGLTILALDLLLLAVLLRLRPKRPPRLIGLYWLSPIVVYICYWHGQLDIVPVALLMLSLLLLFERYPGAAGAFMAAAVSAKLSMALAPPLVLLYLGLGKRHRPMLVPYVAAGAAASAILLLPLALSPSAQAMVLGTPELAKLYDFSIRLSDGLEIYFILVAYILMLFAAWEIRRVSADLLTALLGVAFLVIVTMTPASPGWYLWVVPFLVTNLVMARLRLAAFAVFFGCLFVSFHLVRSTGAALPLIGLDLSAPWLAALPTDAQARVLLSVWLSLLFAAGFILCVLLLREGVLRNDYFRLSRRPLMIGIAGDSGAGKDTLAESLIGIFGANSVTHVSGDDYHLWDRHKPMWQVMTHLNPRANDLLSFKRDLLTLATGMWIRSRHYDHGLGRMSKPRTLFSNEVVIATGLHALYDPELCARWDVRVFLDMDNDLRRFLKVRRDVHKRGHTLDKVQAALQRRQPDRERFILPQARNADLVFTLLPLHPALVADHADKPQMPRLKLRVLLAHATPYDRLVRTLVGVCGVHVEVIVGDLSSPLDITLEGDIEPDDVQLAATQLIEVLGDDLFAVEPVWQGGPTGIMQLFIVNQIVHALKGRLS